MGRQSLPRPERSEQPQRPPPVLSGPRDPQPRAFKADRRQLIEIDEHFAGRADIFPQGRR